MKQFYFLVCCAFLAVGCGPKMGEVTGEVTFKGKPVPGGMLTFCPEDSSQNSVTFILERDGKFNVKLPAGKVKVCIDNREFEPKPATMPAIPPGMNLPPDVLKSMQEGAKESSKVSDRWVKLPERYYDIELSKLDFEVKGGPQQHTIALE